MFKLRTQTGVVIFLALAVGGGLGLVAGKFFDAPNPDQTARSSAGGKRILHYRHPMGLPDVSPVPRKDAMGMDYIPVYEGEQDTSGLSLDVARVQKTGVRLETAERRVLTRTVVLQGRIEADERRQFLVSPRYDGWIEKIHANATGQLVRRGEPLFEVFSPELIAAQKEYAVAASYVSRKGEEVEQGQFNLLPHTDIAMQGAISGYEAGSVPLGALIESQWQMRRALEEFAKKIRLPRGGQLLSENALEAQASTRRLAEAAAARLRNWEVPEARIQSLLKLKEPPRLMSYLSPVTGVITEKKALQGLRFRSGDTLYQITDLSTVWVLAEVFEQDMVGVRVGQKVGVSVDAYPNSIQDGRIAYIYPTANPQTRSTTVRVEVANPDGRLRPGMFARLKTTAQAGGPDEKVLMVPLSAVIDSGSRQRVFVQEGEGRYVAREVRLGMRGDDHVQVLEGVREGEKVVVTGNFLIDSESNLRAALKGFGATSDKAQAVPVAHRAEGVLDEIGAKGMEVTVTHEPVASLQWPKMTMVFVPVRADLFAGIRPGTRIAFEFLERQPGEWVITRVEAKGH